MNNDTSPGIVRRIFAFPLVWAVIGAALLIIGDGVLLGVGSSMGDAGDILFTLIGAIYSLGVYVFVMKVLARRRIMELYEHLGREIGLGLAVGAVFIIVSTGIVTAVGAYTVTWHPSEIGRTLLIALVVNVGAAITEELLFRGVVFQAVERLGGPWVAIVVTALLFGGAHFFNPGADLWSSVCIAIEAGVLVGAAFAWRRSIPFVAGIHFAWNFLEALLGIPVSGHREPGLFITTVHGPAPITGGSFGIEASLVPVLVSLALSAGMLMLARRSGGLTRVRTLQQSVPAV